MTKYPRFFKPPQKQSFFLFGPRGTGKSHLLRNLYPNAYSVDLLLDREFRTYTSNPDHFLEVVLAQPNTKVYIIDEIQRVPELLSVVHSVLEDPSTSHLQIILTGSSARKLKAKGVDLLAGRALVKNLFPFMASELGNNFDLKKALRVGLVPLIHESENPEDTLGSYISLYLQQEVKQEGLARNLGAFTRFLESMTLSQANLINISNVAADCGVKRSTAVGYFDVLEDLLLSHTLKCFKKTDRKAVVEHGKFFYFDVGIYRSLCSSSPIDSPSFIDGAALETLLFQHLLAYTTYRNKKEKIYFWRTKGGSEVDFVVDCEIENKLYAIEVKHSERIRPDFFNGLKSFSEDFPNAKCILLYLGHKRFIRNNVLVTNITSFLKKLVPEKSIEF